MTRVRMISIALSLSLSAVAVSAAAESPTVKTVPEVRVQVTPAVQKRVTQPEMRTRLQCRQGRCVSVSEKTALPAPSLEVTPRRRGMQITPVSVRVVPPAKRALDDPRPD